MSDLISRQDALKPFCVAPDGIRIPEVDCDNFPVEFSVEFIKKHLLSLPSAEAEGRLYIKIYADDEPSVKAEKLYQICGETQNKEVAEWLKEYFPLSYDNWIPVREKLPSEETFYLCCNKGYLPFTAHYYSGQWHDFDGTTPHVDAWQPLPTPYECGARMKGGDDE